LCFARFTSSILLAKKSKIAKSETVTKTSGTGWWQMDSNHLAPVANLESQPILMQHQSPRIQI
jgi:hypothetical protein